MLNRDMQVTAPVEVTIEEGARLVVSELVVWPGTLSLMQFSDFTLKIKNEGTKAFDGTLQGLETAMVLFGDMTAMSKTLPLTLAPGEEREVSGQLVSIQPGEVTFTLLADSHWQLLTPEGMLFEPTMTVLPQGTANESVTPTSEMTVSWQGHTLYVESALPLKSYHIYKVNGEAVATGPISGTSVCIEGSAWQTGVYIVAIKTEEGKTVVYKIRL